MTLFFFFIIKNFNVSILTDMLQIINSIFLIQKLVLIGFVKDICVQNQSTISFW